MSLLLTLLLHLPGALALNELSVTAQEMNEYVKSCGSLPSPREMTAEIERRLAQRREGPVHEALRLDGLDLRNIDALDLDVVKALTEHPAARSLVWEKYYPTTTEIKDGGVMAIERSCQTTTCKLRGRERPANLSRFNSGAPCSDALCAARKVFGERGVLILWTYLVYGVTLGPYGNVNADIEGLSAEQMRAAMLALAAFPKHLHKYALRNFGFYRFLKGKMLAMYGLGAMTVANADGAVFDGIDKYSLSEQVYIFMHELGHRSNRLSGGENFDQSPAWRAAAGWVLGKDGRPLRRQGATWVSRYSKVSPAEDFAESFAMYRFAPKRLRAISPTRYEFLRDQVFIGLEYDGAGCPSGI